MFQQISRSLKHGTPLTIEIHVGYRIKCDETFNKVFGNEITLNKILEFFFGKNHL